MNLKKVFKDTNKGILVNLIIIIPFVVGTMGALLDVALYGSENPNVVGSVLLSLVLFIITIWSKNSRGAAYIFLGIIGILLIDYNNLNWYYLIPFILSIEFFFWTDSEKLKKGKDAIKFTIKKKFESLGYTLIFLPILITIYQRGFSVIIWAWENHIEIARIIAIILLAFSGLIILFLLLKWFIKLNSLKYKK